MDNISPKKKKRTVTCLVLSLLLLVALGAALLVFWYSPLLGHSLQVIKNLRSGTEGLPAFTQEEILAGSYVIPTMPLVQDTKLTGTVVVGGTLQPEEAATAALGSPVLSTLQAPQAAELVQEETPGAVDALPLPTAQLTVTAVASAVQAGKAACSDEQTMRILLLGIDATEQADAIRLVQVDFVRQTVSVVAVPRDLFLPIPAMQAHGISQGRINATYGYGEYYNGRGGGVAMLADTLEANFGVTFDHYLVLNFDSIRRYIDLLGGVDLVLEKGVDGRPEGFRYFFAGKNHFNGSMAVNFMRIRIYDSDFRRVDRQTQVLLAAYDKFNQQDLLNQAGLLVQAVTDRGVITDLALNDAYALHCLGALLSREDVRFIAIPADLYRPATVSGGANVLLPQVGIAQYIQQQLGMDSQ